jgi:hypothetical protein
VVDGDVVLEPPGLLSVSVSLWIRATDGPVGIRDARGPGDITEILAGALLGSVPGPVSEVRPESGGHPARGAGVVIGEWEAIEGLKVRFLG